MAAHQIERAPSPQIVAPIQQIVSDPQNIAAAPSDTQPPATPEVSGAEGGRNSATSQLTTVEQSLGQPVQVYSGGKTARPVPPLSQPSDGRVRVGGVDRLAGPDRCDAADGEELAACRRVIESRSEEFSQPAPPITSPEQRLLLDQGAEHRSGTRSAARRLAETGSDAGSEEAQGIASMILRPPGPSADEKAVSPGTSATEAALVNAIINGGGTTPN